ncbi:NNP family nitrate/nitrite transporter-like MFS transporter [Streptomyces sp. SAI-208]|uniref:nitrate/nitrite transporter n=1 Tax=unclassified Streptomyces TaxID=2593676 RepID=UPI002473B107|nr:MULTISPECIES: nitrate/nitrite transporter [unclassified Streptomyces]MDH6518707.1 NNP family nitrate/nitrite transporter-like MFS transporter [Streptomyces sp. SAI-090]MDH6550927.1 NNP family nitrate/nitrite transporter-like MFS transporter [Streptomyces sp. SAI-041]MDH6569991.1 NNP family nitrate/nitrite transporter-like MFS transporter [Streptomyces sp. SAI-117]MDH6585036.1 NNP family nitrate/nitrite transporter-like MFS transporter [Streptomyces sp. SAI-133]MDH6609554.1 NNP family nitrat
MTAPSTAPAPPSRGGRWIQQWDPEDETFWKETGEKVAKRNLLFSVLSEHIGFSVWTLWSVLVLFMGPEYGLTPADKFLLTSMVTLVGAVVRVPYTFAVAIFGGRNWTIISAGLLLVPTIAAFTVMEPGTSFSTFLLVGLLAGIGGGNFASSMTNINAFFPLRKKGWALGLNAGGGNIGVPVIQLAALAIIGASGGPRVLLGIYIPLILVAAVLAALFMDNIENVKNDTGAAKDAARDGHTWIMSFLYIGTFGSFIGYSFAFGQVLQNQFGRTPLEAAYVTFIGPLLGSLIRPVGGALADKYGGAKITLWNYVAMAAATAVLIAASMQKSLGLFTVAFVVLFVLSGLGNGSTFKMIPGIFHAKALGKGLEGEAAAAYGRRLSGASMGLIGAVGALGGVGINLAFRQSFLSYGSGTGAFVAFLAFYAACFAVTWAVYLRRAAVQGRASAAAETKPQLSYAEV